MGGTYTFPSKDSFNVQYNNAKDNLVDPYYSGIDSFLHPMAGHGLEPVTTLDTAPKYKGFTYTYPINKTYDISV
jgi:hypothetical protein